MKTHWLTIELGESPKVQITRSDRENLLSGYLPKTDFPGSTGHFDWLRSASHKVLGVRYWPFDDAVHATSLRRLMMKCRSLKYAVVDRDDRFISIFFGGSTADVAEETSNDQDMGENGIYENQQGGMALCFEVDQAVLDSLIATLDTSPQAPRG